jgi:hypothetical protein
MEARQNVHFEAKPSDAEAANAIAWCQNGGCRRMGTLAGIRPSCATPF